MSDEKLNEIRKTIEWKKPSLGKELWEAAIRAARARTFNPPPRILMSPSTAKMFLMAYEGYSKEEAERKVEAMLAEEYSE